PDRRAELAARRRLSAPDGALEIRGDLDRLVMKAVAEEPERRYRSAAELGDELERYLRREPIQARPPSTAYLLGKLYERNRGAFLGAMAALLAVLCGIIGTSVGLWHAKKAQRIAEAEAVEAQRARDESEEVVDFLVQAFRGAGVTAPGQATPPSERSAVEILRFGAESVDTELAGRPLVQARLKRTIGRVYRQLGLFDEAEAQFTGALALYADPVDANLRDQAMTWHSLAVVERRRGRLEKARGYLEESLALLSEAENSSAGVTVGEVQLREAAKAYISFNLAQYLRELGDFGEAESLARDAIEILRARAEHEPINLPASINTLGTIYFRQGRWAESEVSFREALELYEQVLEPGHATLAEAAENLAASLASQGQFEQAAPFFERSLEIKRSILGPDHYKVANALNNLGRLRFERLIEIE
ncbi:MAG: tetratricopeptide repeat protein, partial [Acidobacteriota bacterium]